MPLPDVAEPHCRFEPLEVARNIVVAKMGVKVGRYILRV